MDSLYRDVIWMLTFSANSIGLNSNNSISYISNSSSSNNNINNR